MVAAVSFREFASVVEATPCPTVLLPIQPWVDPYFNAVETFEFAASVEEEGTVSDSVPLGSGSGRFVGCSEGLNNDRDMEATVYALRMRIHSTWLLRQ